MADTPWLRLRGLLGRRSLGPDEGVLLRPAASIHMFFMRFAIDAVFLDADGVVLRIAAGVRPWRVAAKRGAKAVLEIAEGEATRRGLAPASRVLVEEPA